MPTKTLIQKYANVLENMEQDAMQNAKNAYKDFQQKRKERESANGELNRINDVMEESHRGFWGVAKAIIKMVFKSPDNPAEIEHILIPIINFKNALEDVPGARTACEEAQKLEADSIAEYSEAEKLLGMIKKIKNM